MNLSDMLKTNWLNVDISAYTYLGIDRRNISAEASFKGNIKELAKKNNYFRKVIYTGKHSQLVVMCLKPGEDIGAEIHPSTDQTLVIVEGSGEAILDHKKKDIIAESVVVVSAGTLHDIKNTGNIPLKLYTTYSKQQHEPGTIHKTKEDAIEDEGEPKIEAGGPGSGRHKESWATEEEKKQFLAGDCHSYTVALSKLTGKVPMIVEVDNPGKNYDADTILHSMIYLSGKGNEAKFLDISGVITTKDIVNRYGNEDLDGGKLHIRPDKNNVAKQSSDKNTVNEALAIAKKQLSKVNIHAGGPGSGRHKTGRKKKVKDAGKQARGLASYNPATKAKLHQAINNEKALAKAIPGAIHISDNKPFDVLHPAKRIAFEVKTKIDGKKHTITMHPSSLGRKIKEKRTMKLKAIFTVIFDDRPNEGKIYIAKGVGSFKIKLKDGTVNPKLREINLGSIKKVL